ncbi:MAG: CIS tube protein [Methylobacter sp.]
MPGLEKAKLIELDREFKNKKEDGLTVEVQFNPESLKLTYANQLEQPKGGDQGSGNAGRQFVGGGTTKLALQLWFDVTAMQKDPVDDVRRLTKKVVYFMQAQESQDPKDNKKMVPPGVRFSWGSFLFDGMVEGMEETIEFFSPEGRALRASITMTLTQQKILIAEFKESNQARKMPGRKPLTRAKTGDSLQNMAGKKGKGDWQSIAAANGIEDPLRLQPGQLIDLNARITGGVNASFDVPERVGATAGVSGGFSFQSNTNTRGVRLNSAIRGGF